MNALLTGGAAPKPKHGSLVEALAAAARVELAEAGLGYIHLNEHETWTTFAELHDRAAHVARALLARGVRPNDRVALIAPTSPAFVEAFFGALLAGAVAVPLYPPVRLGRLDEYHRSTARMLTSVGARIVLADSRVKRLLGRSIAAARPGLGCVVLEDLLREPARSLSLPRVAEEDLAIIQFSSGSTVDPKPVALSHHNVLSQCAALEQLFPTHGPDGRRLRGRTGVSWLPLYHDMGLIGSLLSAVYVPGRLSLISPEHFLAKPALWLRAISRHRALVSPAPNFAYAYCEKRIRDEQLAGVDLSCWELALNGAEPVVPAVMDRFVARFSPFGFAPRAMTPVYGLAEASLAVTFPRRGARTASLDSARPIVSVGEPLPGVSIKVCDARGAIVGARTLGRIHVRGPSVMTGYFGRPEDTARAVVDGWLDTGDLGFVDDGELFVCGREKDVIVVRGENHAPHTFEEALDELNGVRPGCAVAIGCVLPGGDGESLVMLVERAKDAPADLEDAVRAAVVERTGVRPELVRILAPGTLPRTSSGKLRRREAAMRFSAGKLDAPRAVTPLRLAVEVVRSTVAFATARLGDDEGR
ncbi:MAG: fatty acyl-AMP ligase [Deltaproteobacteria bacterium]|nr:fatty acyl-AMP ligase [Deltaproteobacteria bacterium]